MHCTAEGNEVYSTLYCSVLDPLICFRPELQKMGARGGQGLTLEEDMGLPIIYTGSLELGGDYALTVGPK